MPTRVFPRARALAFGLLLAGPLVVAARPADPQRLFCAGSPIDEALAAVKRRNAERVPFDLTYLPVHESNWNGPRGVVAVRPCAIFDRPGGDRLAQALLVGNGLYGFVKSFLGLGGMIWPPARELDMVVCRVEMNVARVPDGRDGKFGACFNSVVLRTREPFDWPREILRMNPPAVRRIHRGRGEYYTVDVDPRIAPPVNGRPMRNGLFVADARTLVIDTEDHIRPLIDRLAEGKPADVPAGWEKVSRGVVAVALSNPDKRWTRDLPGADGPRLPRGGDWEWNVLDDLDELVIGVDDRPTTRFSLTATARDPFTGKRMAHNARKLLALAEARLASEPRPAAEVVRALLAKGRFTPTLRGFEFTADAGTDLLGPLLDRHTPPARDVGFGRPTGGF